MRAVADYVRLQGHYCAKLGSPLYGVMLGHAADDIVAGGPLAAVFDGYPHEPIASAMVLRLLGVLHREVLAGDAPTLAAHYPSAGGDGDAEAAWTAMRAIVATRVDELCRTIAVRGVQTNEVARSAALVGGFLQVARETRPRLRCLEIGTSAGLNLRWDRFRYEASGSSWGDPASPVVLRDCWAGAAPPFDVAATVVERAGCDPNPLDIATDDGRLTLLSYVWPDQVARLALARAACDVARAVPATLARANGAEWLAARLAHPVPGTATVVFHSIVIQYFDAASRDRLLATIAAAGARATADAPLAWLRMEPGGEQAEVRLTVWPGGAERLVATTGFHGRDVTWLAPPAGVP